MARVGPPSQAKRNSPWALGLGSPVEVEVGEGCGGNYEQALRGALCGGHASSPEKLVKTQEFNGGSRTLISEKCFSKLGVSRAYNW